MTPEHRRGSVVTLLIVLSIAGGVLAHYAIAVAPSPTAGALLSLVPLVGIGLVATRRAKRRLHAILGLLLVAIAAWLGWSVLRSNFAHLFFIEHAGANLVLGVTFLRTLIGGREPLCTRLARLIHGSIPFEVERYTRRVTVAWTMFFFTLFGISCGLYLGGLLAPWSIVANIASPLLVGAMFAIEYAVRLRVLPEHARVGILGAIRAYSREFKTPSVQLRR
ncbi:MAG: hypothetical protein M3Z31_19245 [Pseudomonadota bacterium]|nr:hypothetical protein [Pseudomonadota bacterium]